MAFIFRTTMHVFRRKDLVAPITKALLKTRSYFIKAETTPNEHALKFVIDNEQLQARALEKGGREFRTKAQAAKSPLAQRLFSIDGISSVFFGPGFVSVNKVFDREWDQIKPSVYVELRSFFSSNQNLLHEPSQSSEQQQQETEEQDSEIIASIKELIETKIRPAVQSDGGDVEFVSYIDGCVKLSLQGACRTCESSTITLKNGIEAMLKHYIPEVSTVEQLSEAEEDELILAPFNKATTLK